MIRDYMIVSPSLDGILRHESVEYGSVRRSPQISRIFDRPKDPKSDIKDVENRRIIEHYSQDIYGILIKRLAGFAALADPLPDESVKLQALLQEFIKVKKLLAG